MQYHLQLFVTRICGRFHNAGAVCFLTAQCALLRRSVLSACAVYSLPARCVLCYSTGGQGAIFCYSQSLQGLSSVVSTNTLRARRNLRGDFERRGVELSVELCDTFVGVNDIVNNLCSEVTLLIICQISNL